jgi:drug/metabolite transporter (DMT)-like permease
VNLVTLEQVRRLSPVDLMLLATVLIWALNSISSRYVVTHGFLPLAYGALRYAAAILLFWVFTWRRERSFRIERSDLPLVFLAGGIIFLNQLAFVYGVKLTSASTIGLMLGTVPIWAAIIASLVGLEQPSRMFWAAAIVSLVGVALITAGSSGGLTGDLFGNLLAVSVAVTWAAYSLAIAPLMRSYSPFRISSYVLAVGWVPLVLVSIPQLQEQSFAGFGWTMALVFVFAVIGPLFLTNILWFTAIDRVGVSRAALFSNLQPFFVVVLAVLILDEKLSALEIAGGVAIALGIVIDRRGHRISAVVLARE